MQEKRIEVEGNHFLINRQVDLNEQNVNILLGLVGDGQECGAFDANDQHFGWRLLERKLSDAEQKEFDSLLDRFVRVSKGMMSDSAAIRWDKADNKREQHPVYLVQQRLRKMRLGHRREQVEVPLLSRPFAQAGMGTERHRKTPTGT